MYMSKGANIFSTILLLFIANTVSAATISFDDVATGTTITDQYATLGVIFSIEGGGALPITTNLAGEVTSSPNALTNDTDSLASPILPIRADFVSTTDGISAATTNLVSFTYISDRAGVGSMSAYDLTGNLLVQAISILAGNQLETLTVQANNIAYVIIEPELDILVDNFTFNEPSPVPLPAAFWLLGSGLLSLMGFRAFNKQVSQ